MEKEKRYIQIGEAAERTGLTHRTLRFYEERGLLKPPSRMEGGFRLYSEDDLQRIELIKQLQKLLGFSLAEIKEMVEAEEFRTQLRAEYKGAETEEKIRGLRQAIEVTEAQLVRINEKIQQLTQMSDYWQQKLAHYREVVARLEQESLEKTRSS